VAGDACRLKYRRDSPVICNNACRFGDADPRNPRTEKRIAFHKGDNS
jgi:hypothetical protein